MDQTSETEKVYQRQKYEEIIELLLSAGYFRARINTLSEFDKVVGGLCWCITSTGEDIDVDILFQENSTIGQKIALSEAIVTALRKMHCPATLQPHQIQGGVGGSDYPAIYPVIVWLVKKFFERRGEREAQLRAFSTLQFSKNYHLPTDIDDHQSSINLSNIMNRHKAVRVYKRRETRAEAEEIRVRSCLLEYGETFAVGAGSGTGGGAASTADRGSLPVEESKRMIRIAVSGGSNDVTLSGLKNLNVSDLSGFEKKFMQAQKEAQREEELFAAEMSKQEAELMQQMSTVDEATALSGSNVGAIVGLGSGQIGSVVAAYQAELEETKKTMDSNMASGKLGQAAAHKRQKQNLLKQIDELHEVYAAHQQNVAQHDARMQMLEAERNNISEYTQKLKQQIAKLAQLESSATQQSELGTLKNLVALNESLRAQETAFKASCKKQMEEYNRRIKALQDIDNVGTEDDKRLKDIEDMHAKVMAKYDRLRELLAQANLEVSHSVRMIDDVPTRTELIQYERRFVELYQQVAWKLDETKKYYAMYNTLDTTLSFMQKEVKLLNSISENFDQAMRDPRSKLEYLDQCVKIIRGVEDSLKRQVATLQQKEQQFNELKNTHQNLVDEQRRYFKAVKDFQEECVKNEWLMSKLESANRQ